MRISDWSSDVCSSDLHRVFGHAGPVGYGVCVHVPARYQPAAPDSQLEGPRFFPRRQADKICAYRFALSWRDRLDVDRDPLEGPPADRHLDPGGQNRIPDAPAPRSEEHTSELQSLMRISYAVFCLKKKKNTQQQP